MFNSATIKRLNREKEDPHTVQRTKNKIVKSASGFMLGFALFAAIVLAPSNGISHVLIWLGVAVLNLAALFIARRDTFIAGYVFIASLFLLTLGFNIIEKGALGSIYLAAPAIAACIAAVMKLRQALITGILFTVLFVSTSSYFAFYQSELFHVQYAINSANFVLYICISLIVVNIMTFGLVSIIKQTYLSLHAELIEEKNEAIDLHNRAEQLRQQFAESLDQKNSILDMAFHLQRVGKMQGSVYIPKEDEVLQLYPRKKTYTVSTLDATIEHYQKAYGFEPDVLALVKQAITQQQTKDTLIETTDRDGKPAFLQVKTKVVKDGDEVEKIVIVINDVSELKLLQDDLLQSQKLESIGQLAAGIAHEINTPTQFVTSNLQFMQESIDAFFEFIDDSQKLVDHLDNTELSQTYRALKEQHDIDYFKEEMPNAISQSSDGLSRISTIVKAMKDYAHQSDTMDMADINAAIESTVTIAKTEWKEQANIQLDLEADLPMIECVLSDINQVVLNMIVNAAHAISENPENFVSNNGQIGIKTLSEGGYIKIIISDNGNGIPEEHQKKIFDPFFTTKEVGKGTGQGLHITHKIVVQKHAGSINVDSAIGKGTTFTVCLPITRKDAERQSENAA